MSGPGPAGRRPLVIVGCGGFGREVFSLVQALQSDGAPWYVEGFMDDAPSEADRDRVARLGSVVLGPVAELADRGAVEAVIAIGSPVVRERVAQLLAGVVVSWPTLVHPATTIGSQVALGEGTVVAAGSRLSTAITVGRHVHIDQNVTVGHDTTIGDFARLNPQACVSGSVDVGRRALIGANATVLQGRRVGADVIIGASACVVRDVPEATTVKGVPAR